MRQDVYENLPVVQLSDQFEANVGSGYSVILFTNWQKKLISEVWVKRHIDMGVTPNPTTYPPMFSERHLLQKICTPSLIFRPRTALSRWAYPVCGINGCLTFGWGSRPAVARGYSRSISYTGTTGSTLQR